MTTNDKPVWPDELMIRDTGINDDVGGKGQRIYTTAGFGYEKVKYVRADLYARPQPAAPQVPEGWRADVHLAAQMLTWGREDGLDSQQIDALDAHAAKLFSMLATPTAPAPYRWLVGNEAYLSEAEAVEAIMQWGPSNAIATPVYRDPFCSRAEAEQPKPAGDDVGLLSLAVGYCIVDGLPRAPEISEAFDRIKARLSAQPAGDVEALAERFEAMHERGDKWITTIGAAVMARRLSAKPAGDVEADAARYRWLRDGNNERQSTFAQELATKHYGIEWDSIIDMARLAAQPTNDNEVKP